MPPRHPQWRWSEPMADRQDHARPFMRRPGSQPAATSLIPTQDMLVAGKTARRPINSSLRGCSHTIKF
jgi:hypothetical protein